MGLCGLKVSRWTNIKIGKDQIALIKTIVKDDEGWRTRNKNIFVYRWLILEVYNLGPLISRQ